MIWCVATTLIHWGNWTFSQVNACHLCHESGRWQGWSHKCPLSWVGFVVSLITGMFQMEYKTYVSFFMLILIHGYKIGGHVAEYVIDLCGEKVMIRISGLCLKYFHLRTETIRPCLHYRGASAVLLPWVEVSWMRLQNAAQQFHCD